MADCVKEEADACCNLEFEDRGEPTQKLVQSVSEDCERADMNGETTDWMNEEEVSDITNAYDSVTSLLAVSPSEEAGCSTVLSESYVFLDLSLSKADEDAECAMWSAYYALLDLSLSKADEDAAKRSECEAAEATERAAISSDFADAVKALSCASALLSEVVMETRGDKFSLRNRMDTESLDACITRIQDVENSAVDAFQNDCTEELVDVLCVIITFCVVKCLTVLHSFSGYRGLNFDIPAAPNDEEMFLRAVLWRVLLLGIHEHQRSGGSLASAVQEMRNVGVLLAWHIGNTSGCQLGENRLLNTAYDTSPHTCATKFECGLLRSRSNNDTSKCTSDV